MKVAHHEKKSSPAKSAPPVSPVPPILIPTNPEPITKTKPVRHKPSPKITQESAELPPSLKVTQELAHPPRSRRAKTIKLPETRRDRINKILEMVASIVCCVGFVVLVQVILFFLGFSF